MRISFIDCMHKIVMQQTQYCRTERSLEHRRLEQQRQLVKRLDQWRRKEIGVDWLKRLGVLGTPSLSFYRFSLTSKETKAALCRPQKSNLFLRDCATTAEYY